jgi:hypothetical protein
MIDTVIFLLYLKDGSGKISIKEFKNTFGGANASEEIWTVNILT